MSKRWRLEPVDLARVDALAQAANISPIIAQLLLRRGMEDPIRVASFLTPKLNDLRDPLQLPGVAEAVDQLHQAVTAQEAIVVYGDYDADGMTAAAILVRAIRLIGGNVDYYVPNRLEDPYGLSLESLGRLIDHGKSTIISVDCGIASLREAEYCRQRGVRLIITDHHTMGDQLPDAAAIVHPGLDGYPFPWLCGAAVAFKVAWALCQKHCQAQRVTPQLRDYLLSAVGLAAIGTVADVVPLIEENRTLVHHGLISLAQKPCLGIAALKQANRLGGKERLDSEDIAFTLAPRLNAAGRLGQAQLAIELMTTEDPQRATALAEYLGKLNEDRNTLERSVYLGAVKQIKEQMDLEQSPALVLASPQWHLGVIGVVAGKIAEKYHRPTVLIALDPLGQKPGTGSGRSPSYFNLHEGLKGCRDLLVSCGGHAAAAGLRIEESRVAAFRAALCEQVAMQSGSQTPQAEIAIDAEAPLGMLDLATVKTMEQLAPFGQGNPRPLLASTGVYLAEPAKALGSGERHCSMRWKQHGTTLRGVAFGQAEWIPSLQDTNRPHDIVFKPVINDFGGMQKVEMHLVDWRPTQG
ncbi:MAG: single-stranded-DNA-specific exonuclease RecJ [Pirellulaceae bacterium]|jgi:single-stranded-DNA-specific exonuclease